MAWEETVCDFGASSDNFSVTSVEVAQELGPCDNTYMLFVWLGIVVGMLHGQIFTVGHRSVLSSAGFGTG